MTTAKRTSLALHIQRTLALLTGSKNGTVAFSDARSRREPKNDNAEHQHSSSESRTAVPLPQPLVLSRNASVDIADMISDHDPDAAEIEARLLRSPVLSDSDTETSRSWSSAHRLHDDSSSDGEGEDGGSYRLLGVDEIRKFLPSSGFLESLKIEGPELCQKMKLLWIWTRLWYFLVGQRKS